MYRHYKGEESLLLKHFIGTNNKLVLAHRCTMYKHELMHCYLSRRKTCFWQVTISSQFPMGEIKFLEFYITFTIPAQGLWVSLKFVEVFILWKAQKKICLISPGWIVSLVPKYYAFINKIHTKNICSLISRVNGHFSLDIKDRKINWQKKKNLHFLFTHSLWNKKYFVFPSR